MSFDNIDMIARLDFCYTATIVLSAILAFTPPADVLLLCVCVFRQAMHKLEGFTSKMNVKDHVRTLNVIDHYEPFIDFDALLACASVPPFPSGR